MKKQQTAAATDFIIDWKKIKKDEMLLIRDIVKRARTIDSKINGLCLDMDISACHISNPLKLSELLAADDFNFCHDIFGISRNINRTNGQLENCFLPRFSL